MCGALKSSTEINWQIFMKIIPIIHRDAAQKTNVFLAYFDNTPLDKEELFPFLSESLQSFLKTSAKRGFRAADGEIKGFHMQEQKPERMALFGLGAIKKWNDRKKPVVPRRFMQYAKSERINEFATTLGVNLGNDAEKAAAIFAANAVMAHFEFTKYKTRPKEGWPEVKKIFIAAGKEKLNAMRKGIADGTIIGEEINACRELANTPGGDMTPARLADATSAMGRRTGIKIRIFDEKEMKKLGMGGVLGVAQGSNERPRLIIIEYMHGPKEQKPLVLVGKGVTFDTGGLNLKPGQSILEMHMDMSGGAAVIHGIAAIARLKLPINLVGIIPAVENMPSGTSYRPGDLLKSLSGKTIEVLNTDAEGRVILADALYYGATKYTPGFLIDFATLTGAAHVALGNHCSALFTNRDNLQEKLIKIGVESGDSVWPLPLWDEYLPEIRGTFGDIANDATGGLRWGGAIHGAKFLEQFVKNTPWAHLDIAPRMTAVENDCLAKGASGVGVRYIIELAKCYSEILNSKS